jgi:uncharacterized membrane protein
MYNLLKLLHLAAAILWIGGMAFIMLALRQPVTALLAPPQRLPLMRAILGRFFGVVSASIAVLLLSGAIMVVSVGLKGAPAGWHAMMGLGTLMMLIFGHLYFSPWRRLKIAVANADWAVAGKQLAQVTLLAKINLGLGWLAIAAVILMK